MISAKVKRYALVLAVAVAALAVASPAQAQVKRLLWTYQGGFFEDRGMDRWVEKNEAGTYYFKEVDRNAEFIELYDKSRDCSVRLYYDSMYLKGFNGKFPDFIKFYNGQWKR